ncbi:MAG: lipoyl synthase, partial [Campylobacterota bacterium]|nr:lipoyl synthase [Campylobacterota bacterium]
MKKITKPKVRAPDPTVLQKMHNIFKEHAVTTVCEAAACPNRSECYQHDTATFMILGDTCTRTCRFCNVKTGRGVPPDPTEPIRLARAIRELDLKYVVITSVDRDDLDDYGAEHFKSCVEAIKELTPDIKIELLTPDFRADQKALDVILSSKVHKLAHNQECVKRLSPSVRPQSNYERSLRVLSYYRQNSTIKIKSSLMLGLGENKKELIEAMQDLLDAGVQELTLGQYLQPTQNHQEVIEYYPQSFFDEMRKEALSMGFEAVASGVLVRSSYFAE